VRKLQSNAGVFLATPPRRAFTLAEVIIVALIMGIMALVTVPQYAESLSYFRADAAAKRIAADLNLVRQNAITKGTATGEWVNFFTSAESYQVLNAADIDHPGDEYWVKFSETPYPVDVVSVTFANSNGYTSNSTIKYDMYGTARSGDPPSFPDAQMVNGEIIVASGDEERTVIINAVTGEASVQ
jgi:prepilin-type N-terminal cleavage/methylation domain-containing protein